MKPNVRMDAQLLMSAHGFDSLSRFVTALVEGLAAFHGMNSEPVSFVLIPVDYDMFYKLKVKYGDNAGVRIKKLVYEIIEHEVLQ